MWPYSNLVLTGYDLASSLFSIPHSPFLLYLFSVDSLGDAVGAGHGACGWVDNRTLGVREWGGEQKKFKSEKASPATNSH